MQKQKEIEDLKQQLKDCQGNLVQQKFGADP